MDKFMYNLTQCGDALPHHVDANSNTLSLMRCDRLLQEFEQAVHAGQEMDQYRPILKMFQSQLSKDKVIPTNGRAWRAVQRAFDPNRLGSCEGLRTAHAQDYRLWEWVQQKNWLNRLLSLRQKQKVRTLTPNEREELYTVLSPRRYPFKPDELFVDIRQEVLEIFNDLSRENR